MRAGDHLGLLIADGTFLHPYVVFSSEGDDSCDIKPTQIHHKRHKENLERILPRPKSGEFRALFEGGTP